MTKDGGKDLRLLATIILVVVLAVGFVVFIAWELANTPDRSKYLRHDSDSKESFWCGVVLQGDVCYEDRSFKSKYIYFLDQGSDGALDRVVVKNTSTGGGIIYTQATYQLHQNDCDDLFGINSDAMKSITICFADDDVKAIELQNSYNLVRQKFLAEHTSSKNFSENNLAK